MKVMHFVSGLKSGGVEQMLTNYTYYLNKINNVDEYIVYQHVPNQISLKKLEEANNTCIRIHSKASYPLKNCVDTYKLIKKINPDIVHVHMNLLNFIPLFIAFICGIKCRISHSHIAHINISSKIAEYFFKIFNIMFANVLVSCGQKAGEYMYGKHEFSIIPNCVNINQFYFKNKTRQKIRKKLNIRNNEILLGNIGRLTKQKNQLFLLRLLNKLLEIDDRYKLIIIGDGEDKDDIIRLAKKYNLNDNFILHDPVNNIADYYDAMDIFLLPSLYEGFPVSSIEAQASGLPTIMSSNIDYTSKLMDSTELISIEDANKWINIIINNYHYYNRFVNKKDFSRYNILDNYKFLYYLYEGVIYEKKVSGK